MNNEDLTRMAHEAGMVLRSPFTLAHLRDFAVRVAAAEREACAKLCDEFSEHCWAKDDAVESVIYEECAAAIRARRTSTASPATLIDPRGSLGEPIL